MMINTSQLKAIYLKFNSNDINIEFIDKENIPFRFLRHNMNTIFCPDNVKKYLYTCDNYLKIYNDKLTYNVLFSKKSDISFTSLLTSFKRSIALYNYCNLSNHLNIYIILSPLKRCFPSKNNIIDAQHINGGFTDIKDNNIFVFRCEELPKVILHEILHHSYIDIRNWNRNNNAKLRNIFNISNDTILVPAEAVVEFWATIFNCLFLSFEYDFITTNGNLFETFVNIEINYCLLQYNKIIKKQGKDQWKEKTNSYAYIVFKTILLYNYKLFMKIHELPYNSDEITNFIIKYKDTIPFCCKKYSKLFKYTRRQNSLRMLYLSNF